MFLLCLFVWSFRVTVLLTLSVVKHLMCFECHSHNYTSMFWLHRILIVNNRIVSCISVTCMYTLVRTRSLNGKGCTTKQNFHVASFDPNVLKSVLSRIVAPLFFNWEIFCVIAIRPHKPYCLSLWPSYFSTEKNVIICSKFTFFSFKIM